MSLGATYRRQGNTAAAHAAFSEATTMERSGNNMIATVMALYYLARLEMMEGHLHAAEGTVRQALAVATVGSDVLLPIGGLPLTGAARVSYQWNDLATATAYVTRAIEVCRDWWARTALIEAQLTLARIQRAQGDVSGMFEHLGKAEQLAREQNISPMLALVAAAQSQHRIAVHEPDDAAAWADSRRTEIQSAERLAYARYEEYVVLVRWLIAKARRDSLGVGHWLQEGSDLLARLLPTAEANRLNGHRIELMMLQAHIHHMQGDTAQALALLTRSLALAEPEGYIRLFVDEGEPMAQLLAQSAALRPIRPIRQAQGRQAQGRQAQEPRRAQNDPIRVYAERLLSAFPSEQRGETAGTSNAPPVLHTALERSNALVEPLSEREREVLLLLAAGRSTAQIADELVITVGTVRNHFKSIYGKLDAHSRLQAVERARALNLL